MVRLFVAQHAAHGWACNVARTRRPPLRCYWELFVSRHHKCITIPVSRCAEQLWLLAMLC